MKKLLNNPFFRLVIWLTFVFGGCAVYKAGFDIGFFIAFITLIAGSPLLIEGYNKV